ncbi:MAG TPA: AsmA family protein [Solimonas sp.]
MAKPFKILLFCVGGLITLIVAALVAAVLLFDPNDYRDQIAAVVKEETGRDLRLGNIELKIFPWLRVALLDTELSNAEGFGETPFAQFKELSVGVKLLPLLLDKKIEVSTLTVDGLHLNLAKDAQGRSNWQDILDVRAAKAKDEETPKDEAEARFDLDSIDISGIKVRDGALRYADAQQKVSYMVEDLKLETGALRPGKPFDLEASLKAQSSAPAANGELTLSGTVASKPGDEQISIDNLKLGLKGKGFDMDVDGTLKAGVVADLAKQLYTLAGMNLEVDATGKALPGGKQKLQLTGALAYDGANGTMKLDGAELKAAGLTVQTTIAGEGLNTETPKLSGPINVAPFKPRDLLAQLGIKVETADANALSQASLNAQYAGTFKSANFDKLTLKLDQTTASGHVHVRDLSTQALAFALKVDAIDADRYLPPKSDKPAETPKTQKDSSVNSIELPTEALEKLNADGTLDIGSLKINGLKLSDVRLKLSGTGKTAPKQQDLSAQLYGGKVSLTNRVVPGGNAPAYALKTQLTALQFAPFLKDFLDKDMVSGLGNLTLDLTSRGKTVGEVRKALNGDMALRIENGAVKGFNLGEILRKGEALVAGNLNYRETDAQETDFAAISVSARIVNGILKTDDLNAASPAFRVGGSGEIDLVNETINYLAKPTVVESSRGQGGKGLDSLKGLTIPIQLTGSLYAPKYRLDVQEALKQKATEKIREELKGKEDELKQKVNDKIGDLLFGKQRRQQQQQPAATPGSEAPKQPENPAPGN